MKKIILSFLLSLSLFMAPVQRPQAALVGTIIAVEMVQAIGIMSGMVGVMDLGVLITEPTAQILLPMGLTLLGLGIVLDKESKGTVRFQEIDPNKNMLKGTTQQDVAIYNSEIEECNSFSQSIAQKVIKTLANSPDKKMKMSDANQMAEKEWKKALQSNLISSETYKVVMAIRHQK